MLYEDYPCVGSHPAECRCGDCLTDLAGDYYGPKHIEINMPAIRAFRRVWYPLAEDHMLAAHYDKGFDGGEFSGPAHATAEDKDRQRVLAMVAGRFGLTPDQLYEMIEDQGDY